MTSHSINKVKPSIGAKQLTNKEILTKQIDNRGQKINRRKDGQKEIERKPVLKYNVKSSIMRKRYVK